MPAEAAIAAQGLGKSFGPLRAVDDLNLSVTAGEVFALVGPDGAGKTTTLRMLCGIMDPDEGSAQVLGLDTRDQAEAIKERLGYMPQRFGLYDDLTVDENVAFYADIYRVPRKEREQRVPQLLDFAGLAPFRERLARNLSGGMRQKLGLACCLVHTPELLLLDEPTCGVDPVSRREFWQILYRLLEDGLTIMVSTAYLDEAERAGRVALMHKGRILALDTPPGIRGLFVGELLEVRAHEPQAARAALAGHALAKRTLTMGGRLMVTVDSVELALPMLARALEQAGIRGARLEPARPSLEDLFVQIVSQEAGS